jgi:hypothetical protein
VVIAGAGIPGWSGRLVGMAAFGSAYYGACLVVVLVVSVGWLMIQSMVATQPTSAASLAEDIVTGIAPVAVGYALRLRRDLADQSARLHRAEAARTVAEEHARVPREVHP